MNFLLPLASSPAVLVALLRSLDPDVADVLAMRYRPPKLAREVESLVEFEWIGVKAPLEGRPFTRGANVTSADALVIAAVRAGGRRAYLFEWKYTEEYPLGKDLGTSERRRRYARPYGDATLLRGDVPLGELLYEPIYQILRLGLLGDKMIRDREFDVTEARVIVVCPEENQGYRGKITSPGLRRRFKSDKDLESVAKRLFRDPSTFRMTSPATLGRAIGNECTTDLLRNWHRYITERYCES